MTRNMTKEVKRKQEMAGKNMMRKNGVWIFECRCKCMKASPPSKSIHEI